MSNNASNTTSDDAQEETTALDGMIARINVNVDSKDDDVASAGMVSPPSIKNGNVPSCDGCGLECGGMMRCSGCQCAYYCSKDCQVQAWKDGGHKQACATVRNQAEETGKAVVAQITDNSLFLEERAKGWERLDASGPYGYAVKYGLHDAIRQCFQDDVDYVLYNWKSSRRVNKASMTHSIMRVMWRGQRFNQDENTSHLEKMDGSRIKSYLESGADDAANCRRFELWLQASSTMTIVPLDPSIAKSTNHLAAHQLASDIWSGWCRVFLCDRASRAILLVDTADESKQKARVQFITTELNYILYKLSVSPEGFDIRKRIEANMNQVLAMISYRLGEYGIDQEILKLVKVLQGKKLVRYKKVSIPVAKCAIETGRLLDDSEVEAVKAASTLKKKSSNRRGRGRRFGRRTGGR